MARQHKHDCPISRILNTFGDNWTWLIVREAFYGNTRFSEMQRNTGIAKNLLSERLGYLVEQGILEREDVGTNGTRYAYVLTAKGKTLLPILIAMYQWGNEHVFGAGKEPVLLVDRAGRRPLEAIAPRDSDGNVLDLTEIAAIPGPAASQETKNKLEKSALSPRKNGRS